MNRIFDSTGRKFDVYVISTSREDRDAVPEGWHPIELTGDDGWSDNLITAVKSIPTDYILLWLDDIIPTQVSNESFWESIEEFILNHQPTYLRLSPKPKSNFIFKKDRRGFSYYALPPGTPYRNSTILAIWKRVDLLKTLVPGETAWQFEVRGSERSRGQTFYCLNTPPIKTVNLIVKGQVEPASLRAVKAAGLTYTTLRAEIPRIQLLRLRAKEALHALLIRLLPDRVFTLLQGVRHRT